jgi:hypothetical protein
MINTQILSSGGRESNGFEPLVHGLEVMALPHATHAGGRDREPALPQLVGDADLAESRLLVGNHHDSVFDLLCDAVFQHWFLRLILQRQLAAFAVKLLQVHYSCPTAGRDAVNHSRR